MITDVYAMGTAVSGSTPQGAGSIITSLIPLVLMIVIFYFLLIRPQQKKAKAHQEMIGALKKGDAVITNAGFYGVIEEVHSDYFVVSFGSVSIKTLRSAVSMLASEEQKKAE